MTKDEALKMAQDACPYTNEELRGAFYDGFIKALDQLPDNTKMIDTGIDRGAWSDVPDATKWVDELRGDDEELPPVKSYCGGKPNYCETEEQPNSTTDVVESEAEEPLTLEEQREAQQQFDKHLDAVYERNNLAFLAQAQLGLYTAPPKREWQGLTDDEITEAGKSTVEGKYMLPHSFARAIEAKLKEKNNG